jgi:tetratricopeptide (TPR) repeat protein
MNGDLVAARQFMAARRVDLAERHLRLALASEPDNASAHAMLAECLTARKAIPDAMAEAREAIRLAPSQCTGYAALANAQSAGRQWREAERNLNEAVRLDPDDPAHWAALAHALVQQGRAGRAIDAADQGLRRRPNDVPCLNARALALLDLGRITDARATIHTALVSAPESAVLHTNLGFVLLAYGQAAESRAESLEALRLNPTLEVAQQNLRAANAAMARPFGLMGVRTASWWRHRPVWERIVFVAGLALAGLLSPVALFMAAMIATWWSFMAIRRTVAQPTNALHDLAPLISRLQYPAILGISVVSSNWPTPDNPIPSLTAVTACILLAVAASFARPTRQLLFAAALVVIAAGSWDAVFVGPLLESADLQPPAVGTPYALLTDDQVQACLISPGPTVDLLATAVGVDMTQERYSILSREPLPSPLPSSQDDLAWANWFDAVTAQARSDRNFMEGCAAGLGP